MRYTSFVLAAFAVVFLVSGARSADPELTDKQKIAELEKKVADLQESLLQVMKLNADLQTQLRNRDSDELRQRLKGIEDRLDKLTQKYQSFYEPGTNTNPGMGTGTGTGTIILRNRLNVMGTVILNNKSYRLNPGETVTLRGEQAGNFTYEALADGMGYLQQSVTRQLRPNYTYEIDLVLK